MSLTGETRKLLYDAQYEYVRRCMETRGFDFRKPEYMDDGFDVSPIRIEIGPVSVDQARLTGYHTQAELNPAVSDSGKQDVGTPEDPTEAVAFDRALNGVLPGGTVASTGVTALVDGCFPESWIALYGADATERESLRQHLEVLRNEEANRYFSSEEVAALNSLWSSCMAEAGYSYAKPIDARNEWMARSQSQLSDGEIDTALADVACKDGVDYLSTAEAILIEIDGQLDDQLPALVERYTDFNSMAIENATRILGLS